MILRRSRFLHVIPLRQDRLLLVHAVSHLRLTVDGEVGRIVALFDQPRRLPDDIYPFIDVSGRDLETIVGCVSSLLERGFLTQLSPDQELADIGERLEQTDGRDPDALLQQYRRDHKSGADPAWTVATARGVSDVAPGGPRLDILLMADCDLQMEADFLRRDAASRGIDLRVAASFPTDTRFAGERNHDAILVGALRGRRALIDDAMEGADAVASLDAYLAEAHHLLSALRAETAAPILIDGLPEPTVQPLGLADRGPDSHRNRVRRANLALTELVEGFDDVHLVDVAASLGAHGGERLLDDGLVSFSHFGAPGWLLQRPAEEMAAVHGLFPDLAPLAQAQLGDPYGRERVMARAHVDTLVTVLGIGAKKVVVVDLDGVLWPGVLAETGQPFAWTPQISGLYSYIGLYIGIHEALKTLKRRGLLLVCVSKNDEALVRQLWTYRDHYPHARLLTPDDFVAWRVNWTDKVDNIISLAEELGLALDSFVFVDDREIERENVMARLPQVAVMGEDLFALRRQLLSDPRLQTPRLTTEAQMRSQLVRSQLDRSRSRADGGDADAFVASLNVSCHVSRLRPGDEVARVVELFQRTTQFNTTARTFTTAELIQLIAGHDGAVFTLAVQDRFGDHGLVAAAVVIGSEILAFAMSCRVIGLNAEHSFVAAILADLAADHTEVTAEILATDRNAPVRNLYRDNGFVLDAQGLWRRSLHGEVRACA